MGRVNKKNEGIFVELVGGGGASAGAASGSTQAAGGAGYCKKTYSASALSATENYVVGAGATISGTTIASTGTDSTFKSMTASRGYSNSLGGGRVGGDGSATGGDINIHGQNGGVLGGSSHMGFGGNSNSGPSVSGQGYGAGASGNTSASSGANGTDGIVIITEYY